MVLPTGEQRVRGREDLQRELAGALLIAAAEVAGPLPYRGLDELERDFTASENGLERTTCPAVFETARGALSGHRLTALDSGAIGVVCLNPSAQREHVHALLRTGSDGWNIDRVDDLWRGAIVELDDGETAMNTGIDTEESHV
jgi:hypothetical protein